MPPAKWKGKNDIDGAIAAWEKLLKLNPNFEQKGRGSAHDHGSQAAASQKQISAAAEGIRVSASRDASDGRSHGGITRRLNSNLTEEEHYSTKGVRHAIMFFLTGTSLMLCSCH
jgi:hypothetical protein